MRITLRKRGNKLSHFCGSFSFRLKHGVRVMDPIATAARFFAFTYCLNGEGEHLRSPKEAGRYARGNWKQFLPLVRSEHFLNTPARGHKRPQKELAL
jgi:hypothetical protein